MLATTENLSEINNFVVSVEKALSDENFGNFVSNWLGRNCTQKKGVHGSATEFRPLSLSNNQSVFNTKLIDVSMITNMSLLRNDYFELKTVDLKLMTSQWRHHCRYWLVRN